MPTNFVVYYLSQAAGEDLVRFFEKLKFKVRPLEKADILQYLTVKTHNQSRKRLFIPSLPSNTT